MGKNLQINHDKALPPIEGNRTVAHVNDRIHEFERHSGGNIARSGGKPKGSVVQHHGGMTGQQRAMAGVGGLGHATTIDGLPGSNPLKPNPLPKRTQSNVPPHPSMRSRVGDTVHSGAPGENFNRNKGAVDPRIGRQILAEAAADANDRDALAHLGVGINPLGRG